MQNRPVAILLVNSENFLNWSTGQHLEACGYHVVKTMGGPAAIRFACEGNEPIDLILIDLNLGGPCDTAETARSILDRRDLPILFLAGCNTADMLEKTGHIDHYGYVDIQSDAAVVEASIRAACRLFNAGKTVDNKRDLAGNGKAVDLLELAGHSIDKITDSVFWLDCRGALVYVNEAACRNLGYSRSDLMGKTVFDIDPGLTEAAWPQRWSLLRGLKTRIIESEHLTKDGRRIPVELTLNFMEFCGVHYNCAIARNISERKRAEQQLQDIQSDLEMILRTAPLRIWKKTVTGVYTHANKYFCDSLGMPEHAVVGHNTRELFPKNLAEAYEIGDQHILLTDQPVLGVEGRFRRRSGELGWCLTDKIPYHDGEGNIAGTIGFSVDITERKQSELTLKETKEYLEKLIEHASAPIIVWNYRYCIVRFNNAFQGLTGLAPDAVIGQSLSMLFPEAERDRIMDLISSNTGRTLEAVEIPILNHQTGQVRTVLWNSAFIFADDGQTIDATIAQGIDITERIAAGQQVRRLLKEKETILKEVQHRIKNNMHTMRSLLRLQCASCKHPEVTSILYDCIARLDAMMILYDQLYRAEQTGSLSLDSYLGPLARQVVSIFPMSEYVSIETRIDHIQLEEKVLSAIGIIFNELVTNSMKHAFIKPSGNLIRISGHRQGDLVVLEYADNGVGLSASISFETSTGFGMQLVKMLVEQLDGTIAIDRSRPTRILIELPCPIDDP